MINLSLVKTLIVKEFKLFTKNRFFAFITILGMIFYLLIFFLMPKTVNETMNLGIYATRIPPILQNLQAQEGLNLESFNTEAKLKAAVLKGTVIAGISLPPDFLEQLAIGKVPQIKVFFLSDVSPEIKEAVEVMITELTYMQSGKPLSIEVQQEILGMDMVGRQIPLSNLIIPIFAFFLIITETWGLANLIAEEIDRKTIQALLVTPATVTDIFIAKGFTGTSLAFIQVLLFLLISGGLSREPFLIIVLLLLGSLLITGVGFLIGAFAKDFMSVMGVGMITFFIMAIPSINILFPGAIITDWIKIIPSFYFVETIYRVMNFGYGWSQVWTYLIYILAFALLFLFLGTVLLRRRYQ